MSARVAGVHTSAFVERGSALHAWMRVRLVSPGFTPRPSLSASRIAYQAVGAHGVAGVHTSAFVERSNANGLVHFDYGVAGVHTSAFVERCNQLHETC